MRKDKIKTLAEFTLSILTVLVYFAPVLAPSLGLLAEYIHNYGTIMALCTTLADHETNVEHASLLTWTAAMLHQ